MKGMVRAGLLRTFVPLFAFCQEKNYVYKRKEHSEIINKLFEAENQIKLFNIFNRQKDRFNHREIGVIIKHLNNKSVLRNRSFRIKSIAIAEHLIQLNFQKVVMEDLILYFHLLRIINTVAEQPYQKLRSKIATRLQVILENEGTLIFFSDLYHLLYLTLREQLGQFSNTIFQLIKKKNQSSNLVNMIHVQKLLLACTQLQRQTPFAKQLISFVISFYEEKLNNSLTCKIACELYPSIKMIEYSFYGMQEPTIINQLQNIIISNIKEVTEHQIEKVLKSNLPNSNPIKQIFIEAFFQLFKENGELNSFFHSLEYLFVVVSKCCSLKYDKSKHFPKFLKFMKKYWKLEGSQFEKHFISILNQNFFSRQQIIEIEEFLKEQNFLRNSLQYHFILYQNDIEVDDFDQFQLLSLTNEYKLLHQLPKQLIMRHAYHIRYPENQKHKIKYENSLITLSKLLNGKNFIRNICEKNSSSVLTRFHQICKDLILKYFNNKDKIFQLKWSLYLTITNNKKLLSQMLEKKNYRDFIFDQITKYILMEHSNFRNTYKTFIELLKKSLMCQQKDKIASYLFYFAKNWNKVETAPELIYLSIFYLSSMQKLIKSYNHLWSQKIYFFKEIGFLYKFQNLRIKNHSQYPAFLKKLSTFPIQPSDIPSFLNQLINFNSVSTHFALKVLSLLDQNEQSLKLYLKVKLQEQPETIVKDIQNVKFDPNAVMAILQFTSPSNPIFNTQFEDKVVEYCCSLQAKYIPYLLANYSLGNKGKKVLEKLLQRYMKNLRYLETEDKLHIFPILSNLEPIYEDMKEQFFQLAEVLTNFMKNMDSTSNHWQNNILILNLCLTVDHKNEEYLRNLERYIKDNLQNNQISFMKLLIQLSSINPISFPLSKICNLQNYLPLFCLFNSECQDIEEILKKKVDTMIKNKDNVSRLATAYLRELYPHFFSDKEAIQFQNNSLDNLAVLFSYIQEILSFKLGQKGKEKLADVQKFILKHSNEKLSQQKEEDQSEKEKC